MKIAAEAIVEMEKVIFAIVAEVLNLAFLVQLLHFQ
jgi:hypothetical protein